jgi:histidinol phosphatase-like PHP family hydrolase
MNGKIIAPTAIEQLFQNAEDYGLAMEATATPEQIENMRRRGRNV